MAPVHTPDDPSLRFLSRALAHSLLQAVCVTGGWSVFHRLYILGGAGSGLTHSRYAVNVCQVDERDALGGLWQEDRWGRGGAGGEGKRPRGHRGAAPSLPASALSSSSSLGFWGQRAGRGAIPGPAPGQSAHSSRPSPAFCWLSGFGQLTRPQFP